MLNKALDIAYKAHWGQTDKAGTPYKLHPTRVALHCQTEDEKNCGIVTRCGRRYLYDMEELKAQGFSNEVLAALKCLTQIEDEDYQTFIQRVATNPLAVKVKIQDLKDNMDLSRLDGKPHWKMETYKKAIGLPRTVLK